MGREIRRVIPNWEHPKKEYRKGWGGAYEMRYKPLHDQSYQDAIAAWVAGYQQWIRGQHPEQSRRNKDTSVDGYVDWFGNAPRQDDHRPHWEPGVATWYQVYETVSEGTPVTPPFETKDELVEYLVANGDFWDQERRAAGDTFMPCKPWSRQAAEAFIKSEWAPSMVISDGTIKVGAEGLV